MSIVQILDSAGALEKQEDFTHPRDSNFFSTHTHCLPQLCSDSACCLVCKWRCDGRELLLPRLVPN